MKKIFKLKEDKMREYVSRKRCTFPKSKKIGDRVWEYSKTKHKNDWEVNIHKVWGVGIQNLCVHLSATYGVILAAIPKKHNGVVIE